MEKPKNLKKCPYCGGENFSYCGLQIYESKYAALPSFAKNLQSGVYHWIDEDTFGVNLFNCENCKSTFIDKG